MSWVAGFIGTRRVQQPRVDVFESGIECARVMPAGAGALARPCLLRPTQSVPVPGSVLVRRPKEGTRASAFTYLAEGG
jgi:hypothetical protein